MDFGHPPPNINMPPPGMGGPMGPPSRPPPGSMGPPSRPPPGSMGPPSRPPPGSMGPPSRPPPGSMGPPARPGMGNPMGPPQRPTFRHNFRPYSYQMRFPPQGPLNMTQDDFDGKRLRKSVMRKTVDYNASIIKALENRVWQRDWRDRHALQPDSMFTPDLMPPPSYPDNPINAVTTRFVKTATNKMRCPIFAVAWTPEGRRLVTGASSGEFTLWNGLTFNFETILQAHDSPVRSMVWSHGEGWMVTGDHSGFIKYWQSNMNNVKMYQAHKEAVRGISFSPSDSKIVTCSDDGTLRIFDFYRCQEERILRGHGADVKCVQWHPSKSLIVSGSKDNQQPIKLWDPKSGTALSTLHAHKSTVMDLKWNDNGNWLITASRDHLLKLFDIRKLNTELQIFRGHKKEASSVVWHPNHEGLFCSGGSDGAILFWNVGTDKEVGCIEGAHESIVWTMAWHPLGHILCSGSNDHTSKFWTRNRPGDLMRDKYNLNTLPAGVQDDHDLDEPAIIPGMGPEDKVEIFTMDKDVDKAIPGLDLDTSILPLDFDKRIKKVPYSKPIPRNFQAQWNHGPPPDEVGAEAFSQSMPDNIPGTIPLHQIAPSAIFIYGRFLRVEPGSRLERAIIDGPMALKKYIATGEIEELHDIMPHLEEDADEDSIMPFQYPDPMPDDDMDEDDRPHKGRYNRDDDYFDNNRDMDDHNMDGYDNYNGPNMGNMGPMGRPGNMGLPMQMGPMRSGPMGPGPMGPGPMGPGPMGPGPMGPGPMRQGPMGSGPMGPNQMGPGPMGPNHMGMGPGPMGPNQMGPGHMGPGPMGPNQMGPGPMGPNQMAAGPMGHNHMGPGPMGPNQMGPGPMGPNQMGPGPMGPNQMGPGPMGPNQMGPGHMGPNQMGPGHLGPNQMGPGPMGPNQMGAGGPPPGLLGIRPNMNNMPMNNMSPRTQFNDNGPNKGYNNDNYDDPYPQQDNDDYNEDECFDQSYDEDNNYNNDDDGGGDGFDDRPNQRWGNNNGNNGGGGDYRGRGRGAGARGGGFGVNGHSGNRGNNRRGSWRARGGGGGGNRGFRRGNKSAPN